jgi:cytochrome b6
VLLLVYYRPGPDAHESLRIINSEIQFGWLVRSVHVWSANLLIASVGIHMFSVFFLKAYRAPRELLWLTGLALLGLCMVFGFSGYLLPMDTLSFFATRVGLAMPDLVPGVGRLVSDIVRGGIDVCDATVQRMFVMHAMLLPAIFMPILGIHLWLIQKHGMSLPPSEEAKPESERRSVPFFPNFALRDAAAWLCVLNLLVLLAALFPWQLGPPADPLGSAPLGIHPEWYFMSQFALLKLLGMVLHGSAGEMVCGGLMTAAMLLWGLIPFIDTRAAGGRRARQVTYLGVLALAVVLALTVLGYRLA